MNIKRIAYLIIPVLLLFLSCEDKTGEEVKFSYQGIMDKEYRFSVGRILPVTIGQSIETDGDISRDGKYFFYSSNSDGGNFDIYLRSMTDITTVRLTSHPSKDISPAISPDGRHLAFVSYRDNPEGDIFVMKIKPRDLIKKEAESVAGTESMDKISKNITLEKDPVSEVILNVKNANPSWSPDGELIAYSSAKGGLANIWTMKSDGSDKKRITEKGGQYPAFSSDGKKLVFVSYRENENGDLYTVDLAGGKESRITNDSFIKFSPAFMNDSSRIIYSSIEADTNKNGSLDMQDRSVIRYLDTKIGLTYLMTKRSDSSFKAKWLPVMAIKDYSGIIIYTDITGENINLNVIPDSGVIPKKTSARFQYELCDTYLAEYDDTEKYLMSLEAVYNFYNGNADNSSRAYVNRALEESAFYYKKSGDGAQEKRIVSVIRKRAENKDIYASFILDMLEKPGGEYDIESIAKNFGSEKNSVYYLPFALEDIADMHMDRGNKSSALKILKHIAAKYESFERMMDINTKISLCGDDLRKNGISESAIKVFAKGSTNQKIAIVKNFVEPLSRQISSPDADAYITRITGLQSEFKDDKKISAMLSYALGAVYDSRGMTDKSREELQKAISLSHPNDLAFYLSNIRLAEIEKRQSRFAEAEKYYSAAVYKYSRRFKYENFKEKLLWLVNYYTHSGETNLLFKNYKDASAVYEKQIALLTFVLNQRWYPDIYNEYAAKAHVHYIDSYTSWKGEASIAELEESYLKRLGIFRTDFDKAAIYGYGYIFTKKALFLNESSSGGDEKKLSEEVYKTFKMADAQTDWALFIDDLFIEPYILKTWIYQYLDLDRSTFGDDADEYISKYFPKHLWEQNLAILEKALNANDENAKPENEGNLHLNMGNNYFLLMNYPRALKSYRMAEKYKKTFGSDIEKALFHFHLGYTLWQNEEIKDAQTEIQKAYDIYAGLSQSGGTEKYKYQYLTLYRYFALFSRYEQKYDEAIEWYKKILRFAADNRLTIDSARYYQEIAYCDIKNGDLESARTNLYRASALLEKYPDDERKYKLKIKLFGIGPFPTINLGPDAVVVGNNRIYYPLDTKDKKLLNMSLLAEIAIAEGNYPGVIKILKEKIELLKESSTGVDIETRIRSLNNLGYYTYITGNTAGAEEYFNQAENLSREKYNLEGSKASMMNLVNLYAQMIEEGTPVNGGWQTKITSLAARIDSYRKNYFDMRISQERETLEKKAEAKKEKVTEEQISEMTARIEQETNSQYYVLDTASAILKFYLAEILYASDPGAADKNSPKGMELYKTNRDIFNLYKNSIKSFEEASTEADKTANRELKAKLLINNALSYERTGDIEKAYVAFIDAKNLAEQYSLGWVKINAYHRLGKFLVEHGDEVEKSDSSSLADRNFTSAISEIEKHPALYSSYSNRIKTIYRDYINFLIGRGSDKKAFETAERYSQAARIIAISAISPKFSSEYDRKRFYDCSALLGSLSAVQGDLSSALLSGKDPLSKEIASLKKGISQKENEVESMQKEIGKESPSILRYVAMPEYRLPMISYDIFRFQQTPEGLYYWKVSKGKITSGYAKDGAEPVLKGNPGSPVFVLLGDTVINLINSGSLKSSPDYIFVNTLDRIPDYLKDSNSITKSFYSEENGLGSAIEGADAAEGDKPLANYSVVIDREGSGKDITPETLFSSSLSPVCLVKTSFTGDYIRMVSLMEGAYYAGTKRVIVTTGTGSGKILPIVKRIFGKDDNLTSPPYFTLGYINTYRDKEVTDSKQTSENEFSSFSSCMQKMDFEKAAVHLSRWNSVQREKNSPAYTGNLWLLKLLSGRAGESVTVLDSYTPINDFEKTALKLRRAYSYFYSGDFNNAEKEISGIPAGAAVNDVNCINALVKLFRDGDFKAADIISGMKKPYTTILPAERYLVPASEFLYMSSDSRAAKIASMIPESPYLAENEYLMMNIIAGIKPPAGRSHRFDRISVLRNSKGLQAQREEALKLITGESGIDPLSVYPVLEIMIRQQGKAPDEELIQFTGSVNLSGIISKSDSIAAIILLKKIDELLSDRENYRERIPVLNDIYGISSRKSYHSIKKDTILDQAMNSLLMQEFQQSYDRALSAEEVFTPADKSYEEMMLLRMNLYIRAGKYSEAETKGQILSKIENLAPDRKFMLDLQLTLLELNRLRSLKSATIADAAQFEKLFSSALALVKHDTELIGRRGYREITAGIFDEFINYKMKTGQHLDAHYYNEVKKIILASSRCRTNLFKYAGTIDNETLRQNLPENSLYINFAKNKDDLFIWTADQKYMKSFTIEKGYTAFEKAVKDYNAASASGKDLGSISREMAKILQYFYPMMKDRKMLVVSTDSDTEKIPFEIIGDGERISDKTPIVYIPSLLISSYTPNTVQREVYYPELDDSVAASLGRVALRESGIKFGSKSVTANGFVHLTSSIKYDQVRREFLTSGKNIKDIVSGGSVMFAPVDGISGAGVEDFLLSGREYNLQAALLNGSSVQDTNNAVFIEEFYKNAARGVSVKGAFNAAAGKVKNSSRYAYPSNWSGYRLYVYNLNQLKDK